MLIGKITRKRRLGESMIVALTLVSAVPELSAAIRITIVQPVIPPVVARSDPICQDGWKYVRA
jgi:hypothetical protein